MGGGPLASLVQLHSYFLHQNIQILKPILRKKITFKKSHFTLVVENISLQKAVDFCVSYPESHWVSAFSVIICKIAFFRNE
jgi:hypothetical protein